MDYTATRPVECVYIDMCLPLHYSFTLMNIYSYLALRHHRSNAKSSEPARGLDNDEAILDYVAPDKEFLNNVM